MFHDVMSNLRRWCVESIGYEELACRLNCSRSQLASFFQNQNPSFTQVHRVAEALGYELTVEVHSNTPV